MRETAQEVPSSVGKTAIRTWAVLTGRRSEQVKRNAQLFKNGFGPLHRRRDAIGMASTSL